jgi:hypothetical protein
MATRCHVGYIDNGEMVAVYSHWDGYPSGALQSILSLVESQGIETLVSELERGRREGGIRSWSAGGAETYGDMRDEASTNLWEWAVSEREHLDNDYAYIFDRKSGCLVETYRYGKKVPVKDILTQMNE